MALISCDQLQLVLFYHAFLQKLEVFSTQKIILPLDIRLNDPNEPGISKYQVNFLNLISILTNGTKVELDETGTSLHFEPGIITNNQGKFCTHNCNLERSISYYIEGILPIIIFGKDPLNLILTGYTSDKIDCSVDSIRNVTLPLLRQFGIEELSIDISKRGFPPFDQNLTGTIGQVSLKLRSLVKNSIQSVILEEEGRIKRIRGIASGVKVSPGSINQVISKIRGVFNKMLPDVWISTDLLKLDSSNKKVIVSPNYGISLVAQSTTGSLLGIDCMIQPLNQKIDENFEQIINQKNISQKRMNKFESQQKMAARCTQKFLNQIIGSGFVDSSNLGLTLLLMAISSSQNVSKLKIRRLGKFSIGLMQKILKFFNVKFKFEECDDDIIYLEDNDNDEDDDDDDDNINDDDDDDDNDDNEDNDQKDDEDQKSIISDSSQKEQLKSIKQIQFQKRIQRARKNLPKQIKIKFIYKQLKQSNYCIVSWMWYKEHITKNIMNDFKIYTIAHRLNHIRIEQIKTYYILQSHHFNSLFNLAPYFLLIAMSFKLEDTFSTRLSSLFVSDWMHVLNYTSSSLPISTPITQ